MAGIISNATASIGACLMKGDTKRKIPEANVCFHLTAHDLKKMPTAFFFLSFIFSAFLYNQECMAYKYVHFQ
jgi:hypothetical protein